MRVELAGIRNLCIGIVWAISAIVIGSVMLDKSPVALLTGLGAFATVLMLVFRDSILGFAMWILMRCIWHCWSERVWKRIHFVSLITILSGVFAERYINAKVLQIFFGIFK